MPLHRRLPKRGFTNAPFGKEHTIINVSDLDRFEKDARVGPNDLVASGLVHKIAKHGVRVLGDGQIDRALHVSAHYFTASAREKITKAGGTAEVISQ
jgi:large subunit ribosomal protein L15